MRVVFFSCLKNVEIDSNPYLARQIARKFKTLQCLSSYMPFHILRIVQIFLIGAKQKDQAEDAESGTGPAGLCQD